MSANSLVSGLEFLAATPLLWLSLTLAAYLVAVAINARCNGMPLLNPTLLAIAFVVVVLAVTGTSYKRYFDGAQFVHFLLGPAIVAMAVPLYRHTEIIRKSAGALFGALAIGCVTAILSSVLTTRGLGGGRELWLSMAPKSATAAISMAISGRIGGIPALTAVLTISTGITGACLAGYVLRLAGVKEWHARGFAMGLSSHGIATARAFQENEVAGTFAGLAMALNGIATAVLVPLIIKLLDRVG
jgi:predicted murein hydrolase (TIGR00659 family)